MNRSRAATATIVALLFAVAPALSGEQLELTMVVEKEVAVTEDSGQTRVERVRPDLVVPGEEVIYTISYANSLAEPADNVVITNPLPEHMTYTEGSAEAPTPRSCSRSTARNSPSPTPSQCVPRTALSDERRSRTTRTSAGC